MTSFVQPLVIELGEAEGHPFRGNQYTSGSGGESSLRENVREFTAAGGRVTQLSRGDADGASAELNDMRDALGIEPGDVNDREAAGFTITSSALGGYDEWGDSATVLLARDENDDIAGALSLISGHHLVGENELVLEYLGTTGIIEGAGSALVHEAAKIAADRDLALVGEPMEDALEFWRDKVGMHHQGLGQWGWTAAEVKEIAR